MNDKLKEILQEKLHQIEEQKQFVSEAQLYEQIIVGDFDDSFYRAITNPNQGDIAIIAEIKAKSPSAGEIDTAVDPIAKAKTYQEAGADAISYVTDPTFFGGEPQKLPEMMEAVSIPVMQKDFVIDTYQIVEAAVRQVPALLLIARILDAKQLNAFVEFCLLYGIEPVVEVFNEDDIERVQHTNARVIGVNARDLETFDVSVERAAEILKAVPNTYTKIGFSGITSRKQVEQYKEAGAHAVLIGEYLMKAKNAAATITELTTQP